MVDSEEEGILLLTLVEKAPPRGRGGGKQGERADVLVGWISHAVNFVEKAQTTSGPVIDVSKEEGTARRGQGHHNSPGLEASGQSPPSPASGW